MKAAADCQLARASLLWFSPPPRPPLSPLPSSPPPPSSPLLLFLPLSSWQIRRSGVCAGDFAGQIARNLAAPVLLPAPQSQATMFGLRIRCLPAISGSAAAAVSDDVLASGGIGGGAFSGAIHPSTSSAPLRLPGANPAAAPVRYPKIRHTRGVIHLYRSSSALASKMMSSIFSASPSFKPTSLKPPSFDPRLPPWRGKYLLVLAVPAQYSPENFVNFCGSFLEGADGIRVIRNDEVEGPYSIILIFDDQESADKFYLNMNGWNFTDTEGVCHVLFIASLLYVSFSGNALDTPDDSTELPTCPTCLERLDHKTSGLMETPCNHSFQCSCYSKWTKNSCKVCLALQSNIIGCKSCEDVIGEDHWKSTRHCYYIDLGTRNAWAYNSEASAAEFDGSKNNQAELKSSIYPETLQLEVGGRAGETDGSACETDASELIVPEPAPSLAKSVSETECACSFCKRVEREISEVNSRFALDVKKQLQHYNSLLFVATSTRENTVREAVDEARNNMLRECELVEIERRKAEDTYEKLQKELAGCIEEFNDAEKRQRQVLELKDQEIRDLESQVVEYIRNSLSLGTAKVGGTEDAEQSDAKGRLRAKLKALREKRRR
ncbi:hypothetical protein ACP4OV_030863 [Aristida adscensionis]